MSHGNTDRRRSRLRVAEIGAPEIHRSDLRELRAFEGIKLGLLSSSKSHMFKHLSITTAFLIGQSFTSIIEGYFRKLG